MSSAAPPPLLPQFKWLLTAGGGWGAGHWCLMDRRAGRPTRDKLPLTVDNFMGAEQAWDELLQAAAYDGYEPSTVEIEKVTFTYRGG